MKNPIVLRDVPAKPKELKDDFLNDAQRRELRKMLTEKYTKLYGLANPALVTDEINKFFKATPQINQKALVELEAHIKKQMIKSRSNATPKPTLESAPASKSAHTPAVQVIDQSENECQNRPKQMPPGMKDCPEFEGLHEDEWDNIGVYQAYILKQEKELEKKRKQLEQKATRSQLEHQVKEKGRRADELKDEHKSYVNLERMQHERFLKQQQAAADEREREKKEIFNMQTKMIQARNAQLDKEKKVQDEIDKRILDSVETDLAKQRELQAARAVAKRQEMEQVRMENEVRKTKKAEQEKRERKEEIELQKMANELAQDLENQRTAEMKAKAEKVHQMMIVGDHAIRDQKAKTMEEERRLVEYQEKKSRLIEAREKRLKEREKENKTKYKEILDLQIQERDDKLKAERDYLREQASLWKQEEEYYSQFNEAKSQSQKAGLDEYKKLLDQQTKEKEGKRRGKGVPVPDEVRVKALMLEQIRNLELQNQILSEQLKD